MKGAEPVLATRDRVYSYIVSGKRLLILEHPLHPEAGLQVPGGTVEPGESPEAAVIREVAEETGLTRVQLVGHLGTFEFDMRPHGIEEMQRAWFYHLECLEETPESWASAETHSSDEPIPFRLYWAALPYRGELISVHGHCLEALTEAVA